MQVAIDGAVIAVASFEREPTSGRRTLLWLHGAGMDHTVWALQARAKAFADWNSLAPDLPGHGGSGGNAAGSIAAAAGWLVRLLDALGLERVALAGHSMGALIALATAARAPERVARLALLGAAARMPVHPRLLGAARDDLPGAAALIADWGLGTAAKLTGGGTPGVSLMQVARRLVERSRPGVLASDLAACDSYADGEAHAAAIRCPTLVLAGAADRMTPAKQGQRLAERIPGATCVVVPAAGHMMMLERPRPVLDALAAWAG
jgi:pimeloyl-ACP methyl ester carboxylesterase